MLVLLVPDTLPDEVTFLPYGPTLATGSNERLLLGMASGKSSIRFSYPAGWERLGEHTAATLAIAFPNIVLRQAAELRQCLAPPRPSPGTVLPARSSVDWRSRKGGAEHSSKPHYINQTLRA